MGDTNGRKIKHFLVKNSRKSKKSGDKYKKAIEWYIDLLKREEAEGQTKRIQQTMPKAVARIKKFGISNQQITQALEHKGLKNLLSKVQTYHG